MRHLRIIVLISALASILTVDAEESLSRHITGHITAWKNEYIAFSKEKSSTIEMLRGEWSIVKSMTPVKAPVLKPLPPIVKPEEDEEDESGNVTPIIIPQPQPTPEPEPAPEPVIEEKKTEFLYYGTPISAPTLKGDFDVKKILVGDDVADCWQRLSESTNADSIAKSLYTSGQKLKINDYGYLHLTEEYARSIYPSKEDWNKAVLLWGYLYAAQGYKLKLAFGAGDNKLHLLFATHNETVFNWRWYKDGDNNYYDASEHGSYDGAEERLRICGNAIGDKPLSFAMQQLPGFAMEKSEPRELHCRETEWEITSNRNIISYLDALPKVGLNSDPSSYFTYRAQTPLSESMKKQVYPVLKKELQGKSQRQQLEVLLDFCNTFPYAYDRVVWGEKYGNERAFFAEELLYYPGGDCEDHAILFSRLVRDLMHLECVLLEYEDHISTAVKLTDGSEVGSCFNLTDGKFTIADPTYFGAGVGEPMPSHRGVAAKILYLK